MFRRILIWFLGILIFSFAGFVLTNIYLSHRTAGEDLFHKLTHYQTRQLETAYETGGAPALRNALAVINQEFGARHYLLNSKGIDLATGEDRSALEREAPAGRRLPLPPRRLLLRIPSADGRYVFMIDGGYGPGPLGNLPVYLWIVVAIVLLCYALAWSMAKPILRLRDTVVRFGAGDLTSRTHVRRKDELGQLARSFDEMADRITTLLTAERRLLQDISHELRSPLARLRFALALVPTSPDPAAAIARANKEVERLATLIGELLQVTRAEGDPQSRNVSAVGLDAFLSELVESCRIEAEARGCQLNLRVDEHLTWSGDRELLHRAVENVIRNAISYSPSGASIDVELGQVKSEIVIRVRDYGPGVPETELDKIFRPFYRVEEHRARNHGGVGLGLAIAQRAVAVHHGAIRACNASPGLALEIRLPAPNAT
jgi:two-component system sensor histidine kinase CpxA